jgi:lipopolysaccharide assembly outer membrane protein LptD (OstA)
MFFLFMNALLLAQSQIINITDTNKIDTAKIEIKSPSGVDSVIIFYSKDSMKINIKEKKAILIGDAKIEFKQQELTASIIEVDFNTSIITAKFTRDTNGNAIGVPKMKDGNEEYFGEQLVFNMKTNTGTIKMGETKIGEGYYFGEAISKVSKKEMFVQDGYYTTCDAPHPHFHFGASKMKMQVGEKLFADNLVLYVEDIPVFILPFNLYLPLEKGRRSGLIVPSFYFSNTRGVVFQNFGYYWATSDYWDTKLTTDIYTKGGFIINNQTQWVLKNAFNGNSNISFGNTRYNFDEPFSKEWKLALSHNHTLTPFENASVNLNFASQDFNRNTSTNLNNRVEQNIHSAAQYSRTFENGVNASLSFQNDQNIITSTYTGSVPLSISVPQVQFIKKIFNVQMNSWYSWIRDISFAYRGNTMYNFNKKIGAINSYQSDTGMVYDTVFDTQSAGYITHSPTLTISPKFGYFNINPSLNFGANNYFRKIVKTYNTEDSNVSEGFEPGFFTEYNYSFGIGTSTRLYGIADEKRKLFGLFNPNFIGVKAIRHTYQPSINFNYAPDFSVGNYGFYGRYFDLKQNKEIKYSYFEKEGGSHSSTILQKRISYSDMHSIEIKRQGKDTLPDENIELLRLTFSLSHNFAADTMKYSDIAMTFRTPALNIVDFSGNANFTLYDEIKNERNNYTRVNQFLFSNNKGLARLTNIGFNLSTSFSNEGFASPTSLLENQIDTNVETDTNNMEQTNTLGKRFLHSDYKEANVDYWGNNYIGYSNINIPWSINIGLTFSYNRYTLDLIDRRLDLSTSFNFTLAETWKLSTGFQYDFINEKLITPQLNVTKDFHCWELTASWYPNGYNAGFYLRFGIKSAQLRDMKIEKRDSPIFR